MKTQIMNCPFCKSIVDVDIDWAIRNERIFCGGCCKSFPIRVGEDTEDEKEPEVKAPIVEETVKEKFDKGVTEILDKDEENDGNYWDSF